MLAHRGAAHIPYTSPSPPRSGARSPDHRAAMENALVEVVQADVADDEYYDKITADSRVGGGFDYVVNLAAETAHGKKDEFYQKMVDGTAKLAAAARRMGVKKFIQVSTAHVYKSGNARPATPEAALAPWTQQAEYSLRAEAAAKAVAGLPVIVLRPAIIYGPGDVTGLMPRCVVAAAYKKLGTKMNFLWDGDLKLNTVHVFDVVRAIYFVARKADGGAVFNLADKGDTDAGKVSAALGSIFGIETGFHGSVKSNLAAMKMDTVVDAANEEHLAPWLALLKEHRINNTPLSPYLHRQLLAHNHLFIDGSGIEAIGFKYAVPAVTVEGIKDVLAQHIAQRIFPVSPWFARFVVVVVKLCVQLCARLP